MTPPLYVDATMLYRWRELDPVGIVRLERMLASHLRFSSSIERAEYILWDGGYRPATASEVRILDDLLRPGVKAKPKPKAAVSNSSSAARPRLTRRALVSTRRLGLRGLALFPGHLRPFAEQAAWSVATLAVETGRFSRRSRERRVPKSRSKSTSSFHHSIDLTHGADIVAVGLGWEYLQYDEMYRLKVHHNVRFHMAAFDLIPITMPQMNAGQSGLVHQYYAEMGHCASTITSISHSTAAQLEQFFAEEHVPSPPIFTNQLPAFEAPPAMEGSLRRHRFDGEEFVMSVSTIEIRKNHLLLVKIWADLARSGFNPPRLVLVGRVGWDIQELMQWVQHTPELDDLVTICSDVDDAQLTAMYEDTAFTLFPSRVEGWGLPITESLAHGKVCIHSTDPAQLEASQGLMPALHPDDFVAWREEIIRLLSEPDYKRSLEKRIVDEFKVRTPDEYCADFETIIRDDRQRALESTEISAS